MIRIGQKKIIGSREYVKIKFVMCCSRDKQEYCNRLLEFIFPQMILLKGFVSYSLLVEILKHTYFELANDEKYPSHLQIA